MVELVRVLRRTYGISRSHAAEMLEEPVISKELKVEAGIDVASAALRYRQGIADFLVISAAAERSGASAPSTERPQGSTPRCCWGNQRLERSRASELVGPPAERTTADPAGGTATNERPRRAISRCRRTAPDDSQAPGAPLAAGKSPARTPGQRGRWTRRRPTTPLAPAQGKAPRRNRSVGRT